MLYQWSVRVSGVRGEKEISDENHLIGCCWRLELYILLAWFLVGYGGVQAQSAMQRVQSFYCSPAPCVLPPTLASEGSGIRNGLPHRDQSDESEGTTARAVLTGNCYPRDPWAFIFPSDRGSTWAARPLHVRLSSGKQRVYWPSRRTLSGLRSEMGYAYAAGLYFDTRGYGLWPDCDPKVERRHINWGKPVIALRQPGDTEPYDTSCRGRWC